MPTGSASARREIVSPRRCSTANGVVRAAPVTLNSVDIGGLVVRDVQALVVPGGALSENLLGLSYLTRLKRFEYSNNKLRAGELTSGAAVSRRL